MGRYGEIWGDMANGARRDETDVVMREQREGANKRRRRRRAQQEGLLQDLRSAGVTSTGRGTHPEGSSGELNAQGECRGCG